MDFSIIIAHRDVNTFDCLSCEGKVANSSAAQPLGLWATIHSIELDLADSLYTYEYCIQTNGTEKLHPDTQNVIEYVKRSGKLGYHDHNIEPVSPPNARQMAVNNAKGDLLFFFDNHILVKNGYFTQAVNSIKDYNMDMLHSTTGFFMQEPLIYHYTLTLEKNFWATGCHIAKDLDKPYRIAAGGHGGFVVKANVFKEVGGYWNGFSGYGGEELYFDLKMAFLDKTNWIDPKLIHFHYAGNRGYSRHYTDEFYVNLMAVANIIGGQDSLDKVYDNFNKNYSKVKSEYSMYDLMDKAQEISGKHAKEIKNLRHRTLEEQLVYFKEHGIAY